MCGWLISVEIKANEFVTNLSTTYNNKKSCDPNFYYCRNVSNNTF